MSGGVVGCVIPIFYPWKPTVALLRSIGYKTTKVCFEASIDDFYLPIRLRVVCRAPLESGSLELKQLAPKITQNILSQFDMRDCGIL